MISICFQHDKSFTRNFAPHQDGIEPEQAKAIEELIQAQNLKVLISCKDHEVIHYGLIGSNGEEIDYFYSPQTLIEYLLN